MLVAMIMSLGVMNGINSNANNFNLQQAGAVAAYYAPQCETASWQNVGQYTANACLVYAGLFALAGPAGWATAGVYLL
jgi:hypothetical protein